MKLDFSMAKAGDKYIGELEFQRPDGEYDVWTIVKRLDPAVTGSRPKGYPIYLIGTATNSGLLSDYYYTPERGESESKSLEEINADLEVLAQDGESYMSRVKRIPKKGLKKNPPFYAHNLYEKKTHGLNLKQMRRLYAMVSRGNQKAITYARNVLGIPFSESPSQVKAVVLHHVRDLAERRVRRNPLTEDERYHLGRISRDPYLRRHFTGFKRKGKKTRKRVRRNTPKHYHPHFKELKKAGFYDVLHNIEYGGDPMDVPLEKWIKAKRLVEKFPYGSTLRPLIEQRVRYVTRKSYERDFAEAQARKDARA